MSAAPSSDEVIWVPRAVRLPVELIPPDGFDPELLDTWPKVAGRLEHWQGRLLYMPPCGELQQETVADVVVSLGSWIRQHPEFSLATNEAGMRLGNATRAADVAVFRRASSGVRRGGLRREAPLLAVEVASEGEGEQTLLDKADWYLSVGTDVVWLLFPETRRVVVLFAASEERYGLGETIAPHAALPGLRMQVDDLFRQITLG